MIKLVFAPFGFFDPPLSIAYLKSYLAGHGINTRCYDLNIMLFKALNLLSKSVHTQKYSEDNKYMDRSNWTERDRFYQNLMIEPALHEMLHRFSNEFLDGNSRIIGFSIFNSNLWFSMELIRLIREKSSDVKIILGGPDCTISSRTNNFCNYKRALLEHMVDYIVVGEGELTLLELTQRILSNQGIADVRGVFYNDNNHVIYTGQRQQISDINTIPFPDYSDLDLSNYRNSEFPVVFNRGCNFKCVYCGVKNLWQDFQIRKRTARNVAMEIKTFEPLISPNADNIKVFSLKGAYINPSISILRELSDLLISEWEVRPRMLWTGYVRISRNLTEEICSKMKKAGCCNLLLGFESGSPKVCRDMKKNYSHETAVKVIHNIHRAGIYCTLFVIVGFPSETEEDFQMTLNFLTKNAANITCVYCISEFLLSHEMSLNPSKWAIAEPADTYEWKTIDGKNSLVVRKERLQRLYQHAARLNIGVNGQ